MPGCFATGETPDELAEALGEAIALYQADTRPAAVAKPPGRSGRHRVDRLTLVDA